MATKIKKVNSDLSVIEIETKKAERRAAALENIKKLVKDPNYMLSGAMTGKMENMKNIGTTCRADDSICIKRMNNAIKSIRDHSSKAAEIIDSYLLPSSDKKHISAMKAIKALHEIDCPVCICVFCYADKMQETKANIEIKGRTVLAYLSTVREYNELPDINGAIAGHLIDGTPVVRFESFGDIQNINQVENYFRIAEKNPGVNFTLWTKNPGLVHNIYKKRGYRKPANLIFVLSSEYINKPDRKKLAYYDRVCPGLFEYLFTVWTRDGAEKAGIAFNCCSPEKENKCYKCGGCYRHGNDCEKNELLKQDK